MRRSLAALAVVVFAVSDAPAPPPVFRPAPPRPAPPPPTYRPPTYTPPAYRPPVYRPPILILPTPNFNRDFEEARRRSAADAAELLRKQKALAAAERAALLNRLALEEVLRKQANLADLRRLRADWLAVGPGAGLDPLLAMRLEAAERAAEAALWAELLDHLAAERFAPALRTLDALGHPRFAPAAAALELPALRAELSHAAALAGVRAALADPKAEPGFAETAARVPPDRSAALRALAAQAAALARARAVLDAPDAPPEAVRGTLADLEERCGVAVAAAARAECAARFALAGRRAAVEEVLRGATDVAHAKAVLEDLRAAALGGGAFGVPQVAALVPAGAGAPALARAVLPKDELAKWQPPARAAGEPTVRAELARVRSRAGALTNAECAAAAGRVAPIAERLRAALGAAAAPLTAFTEKVEAARGAPFAGETERHLAAVAGTHGHTVAEAVGALAGEANRPAAAARLLAALADPADVGAFAVRVELAGRAPAGFAPMADAAVKVAGGRDRARLREAAGAEIEARLNAPEAAAPFAEALAARLPVPGGTVSAAEAVRALCDAARDWTDSHARLTESEAELRAIWSGIERGEYGGADDELRALQRTVQFRRIETQALLTRRTGALVKACDLLCAFGPAAAPAAEWLAEQPTGAQWGGAARAALRAARGEQEK